MSPISAFLLPIRGQLPEDKDRMVRLIEDALVGLAKDAQ
jgi:hypothetical protein